MGGTEKRRKMRSTKKRQKKGGTKKRQKNQNVTKKIARKQEKKPKRDWGKKKGSATGRFRPKNWPKTAAKSNGKLGENRIQSLSPLKFFRSALRSLSP